MCRNNIELKENLEKFTKELKQYKLKKFKRDERDYKDGHVYQWKEPTKPQRRQRFVSFNLSTSGEESDATHTCPRIFWRINHTQRLEVDNRRGREEEEEQNQKRERSVKFFKNHVGIFGTKRRMHGN